MVRGRSPPTAIAAYAKWLPLINYENRQCGLACAKALMQDGGIIKSDMLRHPQTPLHPASRASLIEIAKGLDCLAFRWEK